MKRETGSIRLTGSAWLMHGTRWRRELRKLTNGRPLDDVLTEMLVCNEGDESLRLPAGTHIQPQVGSMLRELGVRTTIALIIPPHR